VMGSNRRCSEPLRPDSLQSHPTSLPTFRSMGCTTQWRMMDRILVSTTIVVVLLRYFDGSEVTLIGGARAGTPIKRASADHYLCNPSHRLCFILVSPRQCRRLVVM